MDAPTALTLVDAAAAPAEKLRARLDAARAGAPSAPGGPVDRTSDAWRAAEGFEGLFLGQLFQSMFAGIDTSAVFGGGHAEKMWRGLMIQEIGKEAAAGGGIGIAEQIYRDMTRDDVPPQTETTS